MNVVDVGGQRSERRKWVKCLTNVTVIVFVANLASFDMPLKEDASVNRLAEELALFAEVCRLASKDLGGVPVILLLNKCDALWEKIEQDKVLFKLFFPDYEGPNEYEAVAAWIQLQFERAAVYSGTTNYASATANAAAATAAATAGAGSGAAGADVIGSPSASANAHNAATTATLTSVSALTSVNNANNTHSVIGSGFVNHADMSPTNGAAAVSALANSGNDPENNSYNANNASADGTPAFKPAHYYNTNNNNTGSVSKSLGNNNPTNNNVNANALINKGSAAAAFGLNTTSTTANSTNVGGGSPGANNSSPTGGGGGSIGGGGGGGAMGHKLTTHLTCATDPGNIAYVFHSVKDIIVKASLKASGMVN